MKRTAWRWPAISAPRAADPPSPWWVRLFWMVGIWAGSIAALAGVAMALRFVLRQ